MVNNMQDSCLQEQREELPRAGLSYSGRGMEKCHLNQTPAETVARNFVTIYEAYS